MGLLALTFKVNFNLKSKFTPFWVYQGDKTPPIQGKISKFGGKMHLSTVKIPIRFWTTRVNMQPPKKYIIGMRVSFTLTAW